MTGTGFAWSDDKEVKSPFSDQQQCVFLRGDGNLIRDGKNNAAIIAPGIGRALVDGVKSRAIPVPDQR
ncbi:hypothetical protein [Amycolatopsis sp. CA-128772]|uniref:hypothetical protein n=1 Tax=Amycolatopsis sp. CA-128772 TaxID=2073159 RepID=UPI000CD2846C|nr:hypothetical protein [Amycolatopsis sp. CA-128772]